MRLSLVSGPTSEPLTLSEVKAHCRVDVTDHDGLLAGYILAAREWVEGYTWRKFVTQTWDCNADRFGWCLELPTGPLQSVTSISYVDTAGSVQTVPASDYLVDTKSQVPRITPAYGKVWPVPRFQMNAVTVRAVFGYSTANPMPEPLRQAMLLLVGHMFEHREGVNVGNIVTEVPIGISAMARPYRVAA
jgi:uncharacterized phiE125 gp8 family phage protein